MRRSDPNLGPHPRSYAKSCSQTLEVPTEKMVAGKILADSLPVLRNARSLLTEPGNPHIWIFYQFFLLLHDSAGSCLEQKRENFRHLALLNLFRVQKLLKSFVLYVIV